jgi:serine protease DegQ
VGDVVLAIGNPFGVGQTVTSGIVSALGRNQLGINTFENFIQTDAAINPGNSGGALVDNKGNLIGINTAIYSRSGGNMGIGFAIPINTAKQVMVSILTNGSVTRGWIGVEPQNLSKQLAESLNLPKDTTGVLIYGILEGGPADKAGIKPGDVLTQVYGQAVNDVGALLNYIAQTNPGDEVKLALHRKGKQMEIRIQVGKRPISKVKS